MVRDAAEAVTSGIHTTSGRPRLTHHLVVRLKKRSLDRHPETIGNANYPSPPGHSESARLGVRPRNLCFHSVPLMHVEFGNHRSKN